jgi:hypothetical protein
VIDNPDCLDSTAAGFSFHTHDLGHWIGISVVVLSAGLGVLGAIYPDRRWSRAFARGFYWDWAIPRWEVRARLLAWAAGMAALAFFLR